jgi:molybdate transport system ATP-binding protein
VSSDDAMASPAAQDTSCLAVDIDKRLGDFHLRVKFAIGRELLVLFGHSGSGKSVTLRALAGLLKPDAGCITIDGEPVFDAAHRIDLPPWRRGLGLVVQNYALFPHLSVADNIAYGLGGLEKRAQRQRVDELLERLDLSTLRRRRPHEISGGQAQRVALARALAPQPRILLLDEPFAALDSAIRVTLRREIARLKRELGLTIIFVTHDLREAHNLADSVAVFDQGSVLQVGPRDDVFSRPAKARVAELTEVRNIWPSRIVACDRGTLTIDTGRTVLKAARTTANTHGPGEMVDCCIRPERILLVRPERLSAEQALDTLVEAELVEEVVHGAWYTLFFSFAGNPPTRGYDVEVDLPAHPYEVLGVREQRRWALAFPREAVHVMPAGPQAASPG